MASSVVAAGTRTYLVTIQALTASVSASGFPIESWAALGRQEWMSRENLLSFDGSGERFTDGQLTARGYDGWQLPYRTDMDPDAIDVPKMRRLLFGGRVYDILQANRIELSQVRLVTLAHVG